MQIKLNVINHDDDPDFPEFAERELVPGTEVIIEWNGYWAKGVIA